jgi:hypothetical protein
VSIATLIRRMTDAGAPPEAIALAVEEIEALQACLDARRDADRLRKRAQREAQKSADVTGQSGDCPETVTPISPSPLIPPKKAPEPQKIHPPLSPNPDYLRGKNLPDGLPAEPWLAFVRSRKATPKVPFTEDAARGAARKTLKLVGEGYDAAKLLWMAVDKGWRTVFANDECRATSLRGNLTPEQLEERARFFESVGKCDEANDCRRRATEQRAA